MRKLYLIILIISPLYLWGCLPRYIEKPTTNLEFWIGDNVNKFDFSKYQEKYGGFGCTMFYGSEYTPTIDEYGSQIDPEHCVIYTITSFPDYLSPGKHITSIKITDPEIVLYGLNLNSSKKDIKLIMGKIYKFNIFEDEFGGLIATKNGYNFSFREKQIYITAEISNIFHISY